MNYKQKSIVMLAVLLIMMSLLTPPYNYKDRYNSTEIPAGFYLFIKPPKVKSDAEMRKIFSIPDSEPPHGFSVNKNILLLFWECLAILFAAWGAFYLFVNQKTYAGTMLGCCFLSLGFFFAGLVVLASGIFTL